MIAVVRAAFSTSWLRTLFHARNAHFEAGMIADRVSASFCAFFLTRRTVFVTLVFTDMTTDLCLVTDLLARLVKQSTKTISTVSFAFMSAFKSFFAVFDTALRLTNSALDSTFNFANFTLFRACETVFVNQFRASVTWLRTDFRAIVTAVQLSITFLRTIFSTGLAAEGFAWVSTSQFFAAHFVADWLLRASCDSFVAAWKSSSHIFSRARLLRLTKGNTILTVI